MAIQILTDKPEKVDLRNVVLQLNDRLAHIETLQTIMADDLRNAQLAAVADFQEIRRDLCEHMRRTKANEDRVKIMEAFVKESKTSTQSGFDALLDSQDKTLDTLVKMQAAERKSSAKTLQIAIGIFAGVATLVTALAAWLN